MQKFKSFQRFAWARSEFKFFPKDSWNCWIRWIPGIAGSAEYPSKDSPAFLMEPAKQSSNNEGLRKALVITAAFIFRGILGGVEPLLSPEPSTLELSPESGWLLSWPDFLSLRGSFTVTAIRKPRKIPGMPGRMNAHLQPWRWREWQGRGIRGERDSVVTFLNKNLYQPCEQWSQG